MSLKIIHPTFSKKEESLNAARFHGQSSFDEWDNAILDSALFTVWKLHKKGKLTIEEYEEECSDINSGEFI